MDMFFGVLLYIIVASMLIYAIINPSKTFMIGRRWQYKNYDLEPSSEVLFIHRAIAVILFVFLTLVLLIRLLIYG